MNRARLTFAGLAAFGLILLSFVVRGFGQLLVDPRTATYLAAPFALAAAALAGGLVLAWLLSALGVVEIEGETGGAP